MVVASMLFSSLFASLCASASSLVLVASAFGIHRNMMKPMQSVGPFRTYRHFGVQQPKRYCSTFTEDGDALLLDEEGVDKDRDTIDDDINGTVEGYIVTQQYRVPIEGFPDAMFSPEDVSRLQLKSHNVTLAVALMLLDPEKYPTQSRARKAIRQRSICIYRSSQNENKYHDDSALEFSELGKVIARVHPGDIIGFQRRARSDYNSIRCTPYRPPPFDIQVVYEDEHMAIVNKPAGVVVYRAEGGRGGGARGGHGRDTLLSALPHVLTPSNVFVASKEGPHTEPLDRPQPVHRLDRPTSGLMVVAKTKAAAVHLAQQFEFRKARKTYCAIVNGVPNARKNEASSSDWNIIDHDLDGKSAITNWRQIRVVQSLRGRDGQLTLVELKPKTGRYHQLRRHLAWVCKCPIVGDTTYDVAIASESALHFRERGLFLCSNEIEIEHPYYNTPSGRTRWIEMAESVGRNHEQGDATVQEDESTGMVVVKATIPLPKKFSSFLEREHARANKFIS